MAKTTTSKTAAPKAAPSAAPGTKDEAAGKKTKVTRIAYPGLVDADGEPQKLAAVPTDFDSSKHKPLKRTDFADEGLFLEMKAEQLELKAAKYRKEAVTIRELGSTEDRRKAKKLLQMQERMSELMQSLRDQGIDPDKILGTNAAE